MEEQLRYTIFDPAIHDLVARLREVSKDRLIVRPGQKMDELVEKLEEDLDSLIEQEFAGIRVMRQRIADDLMVHDMVLGQLSDSLIRRFVRGKVKRKYVITTKCKLCSKSKKRNRREAAKQVQAIPVTRYIHAFDFEQDIVRDELLKAGYDPVCPSCGDLSTLVHASNLVLPAKPGAIYAISTRVKSAGRYCKKLVDCIFYDDSDPRMKKRNILDKYAFKLVPNYPNGRSENEFRRVFRRQLGVPIVGNRPFEDEVCYALFRILTEEYKVDKGAVEDLMRNPKKRKVNGRHELYKIIQLHMQFQSRKFEGCVLSRDTFLREQNRKSAIYHGSFEEIEEENRQLMWAQIPETTAFYKALMKVFSEEKGL